MSPIHVYTLCIIYLLYSYLYTNSVYTRIRRYRLSPTTVDTNSQSDANRCIHFLNEAEKAYNTQQWKHAYELYTSTIRYAELAPSLLLKRAVTSFSTGDYYEAIADTGKVLKLEPDNILALEMRGRSYYLLGKAHTYSHNVYYIPYDLRRI